MAERRLGTLRHIVFILKTCMLNVANWFVSCSGIFVKMSEFHIEKTNRLKSAIGF